MLDTLAMKQSVATSVLDKPGEVREIKLRSGRQAMVERLQQLVAPATRLAGMPHPTSKKLPADPVLAFAQLAAQNAHGALIHCEERYPQNGPHSVIVAVVDRDPGLWRAKLEPLHAELFAPGKTDPLAPVQLEVIDRATDEALQRLIAAGLISKTTRAARPLLPSQDEAASAPLSAAELAKAKAHRDRATRKLQMACVLGDSGFADEARPALLAAIHEFGRALAVQARQPEPPELADALQPPLSHVWSDALSLLRDFVRESSADWKPVAECLRNRNFL
jgi:hypothetical protein